MHRGQGLAGQRAAVQTLFGLLAARHAADHGGERRRGGIQHQADRPGLPGFVLDEIDQVQARTHRGGAVGGRTAGVTIGGVPVQRVGFKAVLDLPAVGEVQRERLAVEVGQVGQDKGFRGETVGKGAYGDPVGWGGHCMAPRG